MIIFASNPDIAQYFKKKTIIYNLSSLYSGYKDATCLITNMNIINNTGIPTNNYVETVDFDIQYANAIMQDPLMFTTFMDIIQCDYIGYNALILVYREYYRDTVMESLCKLIQQRYGCNAWIVESLDDIETLRESFYTPTGIMQLNNDLNRYYEYCKINVIPNPVIDPDCCVE